MKTFEEILQYHYVHDRGLVNPDYVKNAAFEFARQACEEYRDKLLLELPATFTNSDPHKYRHKVGGFILNTDIEQFIK